MWSDLEKLFFFNMKPNEQHFDDDYNISYFGFF